MINLIPPEGQSATKLEYWTRVVAVWSLLLGGFSIVTTLLMLPSYVLLTTHVNALTDEINTKREDEVAYKEAEAQILKANDIVEQLLASQETTIISDVMKAIVAEAGSRIAVNRFMFTTNTDIEKIKREGRNTIQVQGKADTREALAEFKAKLENSPLVETASIPLADLARDANLPFVITITLSKPL